MKRICHRLFIDASPAKVYEALTTEKGISGWWTPDTEAEPEVNSIARFAFGRLLARRAKEIHFPILNRESAKHNGRKG